MQGLQSFSFCPLKTFSLTSPATKSFSIATILFCCLVTDKRNESLKRFLKMIHRGSIHYTNIFSRPLRLLKLERSAHALPDVRDLRISGIGCDQSLSFRRPRDQKKRRALGTRMARTNLSHEIMFWCTNLKMVFCLFTDDRTDGMSLTSGQAMFCFFLLTVIVAVGVTLLCCRISGKDPVNTFKYMVTRIKFYYFYYMKRPNPGDRYFWLSVVSLSCVKTILHGKLTKMTLSRDFTGASISFTEEFRDSVFAP